MALYNFAFFNSGIRYNAPTTWKRGKMKTLRNYLDVPFDDPGISIDELLRFSTDNHQRMAANDPTGELVQRIAATAVSIAQVTNLWASDLTQLGERKIAKELKLNFRASLPPRIRVIDDGITGKVGSASPLHKGAFPAGRAALGNCADDKLEGHLQVLINFLTSHQAELGAALVTAATAIRTEWQAIYQASETATAAKTATREAKQAARDNLQLMLYLNLVKLMEMFPRQPEKLDLYMQQSLLLNPATPDEEPAAPQPAPTPA